MSWQSVSVMIRQLNKEVNASVENRDRFMVKYDERKSRKGTTLKIYDFVINKEKTSLC